MSPSSEETMNRVEEDKSSPLKASTETSEDLPTKQQQYSAVPTGRDQQRRKLRKTFAKRHLPRLSTKCPDYIIVVSSDDDKSNPLPPKKKTKTTSSVERPVTTAGAAATALSPGSSISSSNSSPRSKPLVVKDASNQINENTASISKSPMTTPPAVLLTPLTGMPMPTTTTTQLPPKHIAVKSPVQLPQQPKKPQASSPPVSKTTTTITTTTNTTTTTTTPPRHVLMSPSPTTTTKKKTTTTNTTNRNRNPKRARKLPAKFLSPKSTTPPPKSKKVTTKPKKFKKQQQQQQSLEHPLHPFWSPATTTTTTTTTGVVKKGGAAAGSVAVAKTTCQALMLSKLDSAGGNKKKKKGSNNNNNKKALSTAAQVATAVSDPANMTPGDNDVILGRGSSVAKHAGNVKFRKFCWDAREVYNKAYRTEKRDVAIGVYNRVHDQKPAGRFLQFQQTAPKAEGEWMVAPMARAIEKICQALREKKWLPMPGGVVAKSKKKRAAAPKPPGPRAQGGTRPTFIVSKAAGLVPSTSTSSSSSVATKTTTPPPSKTATTPKTATVPKTTTAPKVTASTANNNNSPPRSKLSHEQRNKRKSPQVSGDETFTKTSAAGVAEPAVTKTPVILNAGTRVSVYWPLDDAYYDATVHTCSVNYHYLEYDDDGETEWLDLSKNKFRIRSSPPAGI